MKKKGQNMNRPYRHGDVDLIPVNVELTGDKQKNGVIAEGEVTGHSHRIVGKIGIDFNVYHLKTPLARQVGGIKVSTNRVLEVVNPVEIEHQEHSRIQIAPGRYGIFIEQEYDPFEEEVRRVKD